MLPWLDYLITGVILLYAFFFGNSASIGAAGVCADSCDCALVYGEMPGEWYFGKPDEFGFYHD